MFFRFRGLSRLVRSLTSAIPQTTAEKWYKRLVYIYAFCGWNMLGYLFYLYRNDKFDYAKTIGLRTEFEDDRSKAIRTMEMLGVPKTRVIKVKGFTVVSDEEVINEALLDELEDEKEQEEEIKNKYRLKSQY